MFMAARRPVNAIFNEETEVQMNRRVFAKHFMLGTLAACSLARGAGVGAKERVLSVAWSGGAAGDAEKKVYVPAFEKKMGWKVEMTASELALLPQLESMVKVGQTHWDIAELSGGKLPIAAGKGLLEKIDYSLIDPQSRLPAVAREQYGVAWGTYSTVLVQNTGKAPHGRKMRSWADFWDLKTFPGPRSLRSWPQGNLEFALLADGVAKKDVYNVLASEAGLDRALKKLGELKPHIPTWWENGAQSVQLLSDGEVFYATTFNGRVQKLVDDGVPAEIVWNGGALHVAYMGIPKGSKNIRAAHDYIQLRTMRADLDRAYLKLMPYPGFAPGLLDGLPPAVVDSLPASPGNVAAQFVMNDAFWAKHIKSVQERWNEWMLR